MLISLILFILFSGLPLAGSVGQDPGRLQDHQEVVDALHPKRPRIRPHQGSWVSVAPTTIFLTY